MRRTVTPVSRALFGSLLGRRVHPPRFSALFSSLRTKGSLHRRVDRTTSPALPPHGDARSICTTVPGMSPLPIESSTYVPPSEDDPTKQYRPPPVYPIPAPRVVRKLRAISPFPSHVQTFLRAFPSFKPVGFHSVPRHAIAKNPLRRDLILQVVTWQRNMSRQGTKTTKNRSRTNGSRKKMRPQKGTGRARMGDRKAPHLRGGGHCHALWSREFTTTLSLKRQCLGLRHALTAKFIQNQLSVVETLKETPPPENKPTQPRPSNLGMTPQAVLDVYEKNKDALRQRLEHILEFNAHRNFVASKKPPKEFVPQYVPVQDDIDSKYKMSVEFDRVLLCISRNPEEEKRLTDMELRSGLRPPPDPTRPLGKYLDSYWNIWEAAHKSEKVEVCFANDLDCYRLMKYRNIIIEKDALDLVVDRTDF